MQKIILAFRYKHNETEYDCWVSTMDSSVAITKLDLERAKGKRKSIIGLLLTTKITAGCP